METALYVASYNGHKEVVELLLSKGAEIDKEVDGITALYGASLNSQKEVVELLLSKGAEIDKGDITALSVSSFNGHKEVVELLLEKGAEIDKVGSIYGTALSGASENGHKEVVELLLTKGAVDLKSDTIYQFISNKQNKTSDKLLLIRANLHKLKYLDNKDESLVCSVFKCDDTELLIFILETLKEDTTLIDDFLLNVVALAIELKAFNCLKEVFFRIKDREKIDVLINRDDLSQLVTLNKAEI